MNRMLLNVKDVSFAYPGMAEYLFEGVNFSIYSGERIGLLGYNGSGKSTLLDTIKGEKIQDKGEIANLSEGTFYFRQEDYAQGGMNAQQYLLSSRPKLYWLYEKIKEMEKSGIRNPMKYSELINEFGRLRGYEFIQKIKETITKFGFLEEVLRRRVNTLSGGEKRLLKLASGFLGDYDFFLLDEPTNYLDSEGIVFLIGAIHSSKSAYLIVSHDRWFLDETVEKILEIERGKIREYAGNYSVFIHTKVIERKERMRKKKKIESEIKHLKEVERSYKVWGKRREKEKIGAGDKGYVSHKAAKLMKRSMIAKKHIQEKIRELKKTKPYIEKWHDFEFEPVNIPTQACLTVNRLTKSIGDKLLFRELSFIINWGERVALIGPNGAGKTTLLQILLGLKTPEEGDVIWDGQAEIGYLPQKWDPVEDEETPSEIFQKTQYQKARTLMGCLKVRGEEFNKRFGELSEGQKRKIKLVQLLISKPNVLILDEPTTHLDYVTVEKLEEALKNFKGTIILVSHDKFLLERVSRRDIMIQK